MKGAAGRSTTVGGGVARSAYQAEVDGCAVDLFTLRNSKGMVARLTNHGARLVELFAFDRHGRLGDVVLGYETLNDVLRGHISMGATIGRYANRIREAQFTLDGETFRLSANDGRHHLHGGTNGSRCRVFQVAQFDEREVIFSCRFKEGEEGYPGNCDLLVSYSLSDSNELHIRYAAVTDAPTPVNFTNHTFWNLSAGRDADVLGHEMTVAAREFAPTDREALPTGVVEPVAGKAFDFNAPMRLGARIGRGYSINYLLKKENGHQQPAARLGDPVSGRVLEVFTSEPSLLLFTGNNFAGALPQDRGKGGRIYGRHAGLALETQHLPDSPNIPAFPCTVLRPGCTYHSWTTYEFRIAPEVRSPDQASV